MKFVKGSREWQMFVDIWNLASKWWDLPKTDDEWADCVYEVDDFVKKYNGQDMLGFLALEFGMALCNALSKTDKQRKTSQNARKDT